MIVIKADGAIQLKSPLVRYHWIFQNKIPQIHIFVLEGNFGVTLRIVPNIFSVKMPFCYTMHCSSSIMLAFLQEEINLFNNLPVIPETGFWLWKLKVNPLPLKMNLWRFRLRKIYGIQSIQIVNFSVNGNSYPFKGIDFLFAEIHFPFKEINLPFIRIHFQLTKIAHFAFNRIIFSKRETSFCLRNVIFR